MTVKLEIEISQDGENPKMLLATLKTDDSIIAGSGKTPYNALRDLINELEFQYQYFRGD